MRIHNLSKSLLLAIALLCWSAFGLTRALKESPSLGTEKNPYVLLQCHGGKWGAEQQLYQDTYSRRLVLPDGTHFLIQRSDCFEL